MIAFFLNLDFFLTDVITKLLPHNIILDWFFLFLSFNGLTIIIWAVLLILFLLFEIKNPKRFIVYFLLSFATTWFFTNVVIKNIVQRERPYIANQIETLYCPPDFSFPSGHAAGAFVGAVIFAYFDKKRQWLYYSVASFIALSRIYLYCHYFFDVFFGAFLGYMIGKLFLLYISDNKNS